MIVTPHNGIFHVTPDFQALAVLAHLDAIHVERQWPKVAANPPKKLPEAGQLLVPHFWTGDLIQAFGEFGHKSNGYVIWEGLSPYDGKPIVCIATGFLRPSDNEKTGPMIQTYIIRSDMHPQEAIDTGGDASICFECDFRGNLVSATAREIEKQPHRGEFRRKDRVCYVNIGKAVAQVYKAYKNGSYPKVEKRHLAALFGAAHPLRIGSYGEPVAVPEEIWRECLTFQTFWTGYTHAWLKPEFQGFRDFCMASVNSPDEMVYAQKVLGWRTYRTGGPDQLPIEGAELVCPYYPEAGFETRWTCDTCMRCSGRHFTGRSIVAPAHGPGSKAFMRREDKGFTTPDGTHYPPGYFADFHEPRQDLYRRLEKRRIAMRRSYEKRRARLHRRKKRNPGHRHPHLKRPVSRMEIEDQVQHLRERAGLKGHPVVSWPHPLTLTHEDNHRRYAQVFFGGGDPQVGGFGIPRYEFAEQARWLPKPHRLGLVAHEIGHELAGPEGSEDEADEAALQALGVKIGYDKRWPGKGLQKGRMVNPPRGKPKRCICGLDWSVPAKDHPPSCRWSRFPCPSGCGVSVKCPIKLHPDHCRLKTKGTRHGRRGRRNPHPPADRPRAGYEFDTPVYAWWGKNPADRARVRVLGPAFAGHYVYWHIVDPDEGDVVAAHGAELFTPGGCPWIVLPSPKLGITGDVYE